VGEAGSTAAASACSAAATACDRPSKRPSPSEEASNEGDKAKLIPRLAAPACQSAGRRRSGTSTRTSCVRRGEVEEEHGQPRAPWPFREKEWKGIARMSRQLQAVTWYSRGSEMRELPHGWIDAHSTTGRTRAHAHTHTRTHARARTHTHTHTHTHTNTRTHTCASTARIAAADDSSSLPTTGSDNIAAPTLDKASTVGRITLLTDAWSKGIEATRATPSASPAWFYCSVRGYMFL